ncbi:hypothetical protein PAXRUDRAFT_162224 [Paxillus rubicundulus Ve08.2h10]|uniref:Uncharacterized protein n=1 Tax=Paxillus rubicundulus Ve08.2h10 TaxID=930991 RepID=A0A0D0D614_9AGAM|nr:hypothetical protein PAXRUDRAFT_162224 [Paxillus rubicundulus Ve08.2h10]
MLSQGDAQNIPREFKLLCSIYMLQALSPVSYNPMDCKVHTILKVLAALCESLIEPFFNPKLSLNNQLKSLSKYVHLSFVLYCQHTTSFMSNQLYGDTQAMIKNIMFLVAWQQEVDDSEPLYIIQSGEDQLEGCFGVVCSDGHDPNMDVPQLCQHISVTADCLDIFEEHSDWD